MEYKFASRMDRMKASEIRELLKLTARPDIISFAGGLPAPELFPVKEIAQVSHDLVLKEGQKLLQYATTEGRPTLREKIAKRMTEKYKTPVVADDILITTGMTSSSLPVPSSVWILPASCSWIPETWCCAKARLIWAR